MNQTEYIIGQSIRFVPACEMMRLEDSPETEVILTPACNRLLVYLISCQGQVLSRDVIFTTLWEQYGYSPSNGSLNTYMSLIRKAFVNLGMLDEVITTIPKVGFVFNPDMPVEKIEIVPKPPSGADSDGNRQDEPGSVFTGEHPVAAEPLPDNTVPPLPALQPADSRKKNTWTKAGLLFSAGVLALAGTAWLMTDSQTLPPLPTPLLKAGMQDSCDILFIPLHAGDTIMFTETQARWMVTQSGFVCKPGGAFFVYADRAVTAGNAGKVYVSYCQRERAEVSSCRDFMDHHMVLPPATSD